MVNVSFKYKNFWSNRLNEIVTDAKTLVLRVYSSIVHGNKKFSGLLACFFFIFGWFLFCCLSFGF